jgi:hypothetical protein
MNTGQTMLTTAALVLLGATSISVNRSSLNTGTIVRGTEIGVYAVSLASSYLEKAEGTNYDRYDTTTGITITNLSQLTPAASLGIETAHGEMLNKPGGDPTTGVGIWDDFDDFNKMCVYDTIKGVDIFCTRDTVYYVTEYYPDVSTTSTTWFKRMDVRTSGTLGRGAYESGNSQQGIDTVKLSYVYSYFQMP